MVEDWDQQVHTILYPDLQIPLSPTSVSKLYRLGIRISSMRVSIACCVNSWRQLLTRRKAEHAYEIQLVSRGSVFLLFAFQGHL